MNYNTELQSNNTDLQSILDTINALPDAGSDGTSVETCTVTINLSGLSISSYCATIYRNGSVGNNCVFTTTSSSFTIENVVCGSPIVLLCYILLDEANGLTVYTLSSDIQLIDTTQLSAVLVPYGDSTATITYD